MSKVVVLGGSGFIGSRLVARLRASGHEVLIGDKRPSTAHPDLWSQCDVTIGPSLHGVLAGADVVFNLAAEHRDDVRPLSRYREVNVGGAEVVCGVASELGIRKLVFTSSVAVYGFPRGVLDEDAPCAPFNEYGRTKLQAESVYRAWWERDRTRTLVTVRPTVVFGEGNRGNVYNLLNQIASGRFVMVGNGRNHKSLAYVENLVGFLVHVLGLSPGAHLFNYADQPDYDMRALTAQAAAAMGRTIPGYSLPYGAGLAAGLLLDAVARLTGRTFPLSAVRVRKFCADTQFSAERAFATGHRAEVSLPQALERVIRSDFS